MPMVPVTLGRICTGCQVLIWGLPDATDDLLLSPVNIQSIPYGAESLSYWSV